MEIKLCTPEATVVDRAALDNPQLLLIPDTKPGEVSYFIAPIVNSIIENLKVGLTLDDCAAAVGVPVEEVKKWQKENRGNFGNIVAKAEVEHKKLYLMKMMRGKADWKSAAFMLERKWRKEYGRDVAESNGATAKQVFKVNGVEIEF